MTITLARTPEIRLFPLTRHELLTALSSMLPVLGIPNCSLECTLTGDAQVQALNERFLNTPGPTNILSFPADHGNTPYAPASLALSAHACLREAFLYRQDPRLHCLRLLSHGLAHLSGLDHGPDMEQLSQEIFRAGSRALEQLGAA